MKDGMVAVERSPIQRPIIGSRLVVRLGDGLQFGIIPKVVGKHAPDIQQHISDIARRLVARCQFVAHFEKTLLCDLHQEAIARMDTEYRPEFNRTHTLFLVAVLQFLP